MMGSKRNHLIIIIITFIILMFNFTWSSQGDHVFLDSFLHNYAVDKVPSPPHTGKMYNVPLPAKLRGVKLSFSRLRTQNLWTKGTNQSSYFSIPPRTFLPRPLRKRVDLICQNLGNWSTSYYNVPDHTFVAPVLGFLVYDPSKTSSNLSYPIPNLNFTGENPGIVRFPIFSIKKRVMKCVRFDINGTLELSDMVPDSGSRSCVVRNQGHFSIVTPILHPVDKVIKDGIVVGVAVGGLVASVLVAVVCVLGYRGWAKMKRAKETEEKTELGVALEKLWHDRNRFHFVTQPVVAEYRYVI